MIQFRPLPVMSVLALAALAILLMLGSWQWSRYQEKIAYRASPPALERLGPILPRPDDRVLLYGVKAGVAGWRVLTPVQTGAPPQIRTIFVDSAFVAGVAPPVLATIPADPRFAPGATIEGLRTQPAPPSAFAPSPDITRRAFFAFDPVAMKGGLSAPDAELFLLPYADGPNPFTAAADPLPPERHMGYAATWWGLAIVLVGVYAAFHARAGRLKFGGGKA